MKGIRLILWGVLFVSCTSKSEPYEKLLKGDFEFYSTSPSCHCDSLTQTNFSFFRYDTLFTGTCFKYYRETTKLREEKHIFNGKMHGLYTAFTPKGDTLIAKLYNNGFLINPQVNKPYTCPCDSLLFITEDDRKRATRFNFYFSGKCFTYFNENDTIKSTIENYSSGYLEGSRIIYDSQGNMIREEIFEAGLKK